MVTMSDLPDTDTDVDTVARWVLASLVHNALEDYWGDYPDLGERVWEWVTQRVHGVLPVCPDPEDFDAAYIRLAAAR